MSYITKQDVLNFLQTDTNSYIDNGFSDWLNAVEAYIEKYTDKEFEKVEDATRYYDGNGKRILPLTDDLISITTLQILESNGSVLETLTEGHSKDFILYPYNTTPKYEIRLTNSASVGAFYTGNKRVKVIGTFGNSDSVPDDIKHAATLMIAEIINRGKNGGKIQRIALGDYDVSYANSGSIKSIAEESGAKSILDSYKEYYI